MTTTDDFQNADVLYPETLPAVKAALTRQPGAPQTIPVVTGFLGRGLSTGMQPLLPPPMLVAVQSRAHASGTHAAHAAHSQGLCRTGAITTLGRGGSDLTATVIGAALGVREVQVWKDVDGARASAAATSAS